MVFGTGSFSSLTSGEGEDSGAESEDSEPASWVAPSVSDDDEPSPPNKLLSLPEVMLTKKGVIK
jgi:hypothetical protein